MKSKVQPNEYPGYPGPPTAEAKVTMRSKLEEICDASPPDATRLIQVWRALIEEDRPRTKIRMRPRTSTQ